MQYDRRVWVDFCPRQPYGHVAPSQTEHGVEPVLSLHCDVSAHIFLVRRRKLPADMRRRFISRMPSSTQERTRSAASALLVRRRSRGHVLMGPASAWIARVLALLQATRRVAVLHGREQ
jgi:hypothetical protein